MPAAALQAVVHRRTIPGLDAIRVVAIVLVVLFHSGVRVPGDLGVILFFTLSGFLITTLLLKEREAHGRFSVRDFYRRRAYRILPTFYVCWLLTILFMLWRHQPIFWRYALASGFYLADYGRALASLDHQYRFPVGVSWSLAIEEQFYLLWPLALLGIVKIKRPASAVAMMIATIWAWRFLLALGFHVSPSYMYNAFDTRADALLVGCGLALSVFSGKAPRPLSALLAARWLALLPLAALVFTSYLDATTSSQWMPFALSLEPLLAAAVLLQWMFWGSVGWPWLEHRFVKLLARLSYAIYLYHPLTTALVDTLHLRHGNALLGALLFLPVALASYYGIERPFLRMRDRGRRGSVLLDDGLQHSA